jgi:hypothetical protein
MRRFTHAATALAAIALGCGGRDAPGVSTPAPGTTPAHAALWSKHIGPGWVNGVAFDASGNVFVAGSIQGAFDAALGSGGAGDPKEPNGFVAEFDRAGNVMWVHRWGSGAAMSPGTASSVTVNDKGISVLGLAWGGVVDLGGGSLSVPQKPQGSSTAFLAHYAAGGAFVSAALLEPSSLCQTSYCDPAWMGFDDSGNVFSVTSVPSMSSPPQGEVLLTKSDSDGKSLWTKSVPNAPGSGRPVVSTAGTIAIFEGNAVMTFGPDGSPRWSRQFDWANPLGAVAFDSSGDVIVGGTFALQIDLGGPTPLQSPANDRQLPADYSAQPIFIVKYDAGGNYLWSHAYGSTPRAQSTVGAIRVAPNQDVLFTGGFAGAIDFGTGAFQTTSDAESVGDHDAFLARLSRDGTGQWSAGFGGPGLGDTGSCLAVAPDGRVAMGGGFDGTIDFGNGPFTSVGFYHSQFGPGSDGFVAVFGP